MIAGHVMVIAEVGVNHDGSLDRALQLVDAAADAGADAVKFQTFTAEALATAVAPKADYQSRAAGPEESQLEMLRRLELDAGAHRRLVERCADRGVRFLSSPFDLASIELLAALGVDTIKVPSGAVTDLPYLRKIGAMGVGVLLSTGMADLEEVRAALEILEGAGTSRGDVVVLHCTTEYPTPLEEVNLRAMVTMKDELGVRVGYSDHTRSLIVPVCAVAMGAEVVEKHFTLDRTLPGPDHAASVEPAELAGIVRAIREAEVALGSALKAPTSAECRNAEVVRKSIVAARDIAEGELFDENNLTTKRPAAGLTPMMWDDVLGRRATRAFEKDEPVAL